MKKKFLLLTVAVLTAMSMMALTYQVTVPAGTNKCYIAGAMNGWSHTEMNRVDATHYTINIDGATTAQGYKYCSGPSWDYEELTATGGGVSNRAYSPNDVVEKWKAVYGQALNYTTYTDFSLRHPWNGEEWSDKEMTSKGGGVFELHEFWGAEGANVSSSCGNVVPNWIQNISGGDGIEKGAEVLFVLKVTAPEAFTLTVSKNTSINAPAEGNLSAANGRINCPVENFVIYNTIGMNVTAQNGNLKGLYIVKYNGKAASILVK